MISFISISESFQGLVPELALDEWPDDRPFDFVNRIDQGSAQFENLFSLPPQVLR